MLQLTLFAEYSKQWQLKLRTIRSHIQTPRQWVWPRSQEMKGINPPRNNSAVHEWIKRVFWNPTSRRCLASS
jgi:hypothetical protein